MKGLIHQGTTMRCIFIENVLGCTGCTNAEITIANLVHCKKNGKISDNLSQTGMKSTFVNKNNIWTGHFVTSISRTSIIHWDWILDVWLTPLDKITAHHRVYKNKFNQ